MADYCKECSEKFMGADYGDLRGLTTEDDTKAGLYAHVICEGCGFIQVDHMGKCVGGAGCNEKHIYETKTQVDR